MIRTDGYYIAPYAPDGEQLGVGFWEYSKLSQKWLDNCSGFIDACGGSCRQSWGQQLHRVETKLTASSGAGLATFFIDGLVALSSVYASGMDLNLDNQVLRLFVESMRRVDTVRQASHLAEPFESLLHIPDRPLAGVVVWQPLGVGEEDYELLQQLSNHFAAAFFIST